MPLTQTTILIVEDSAMVREILRKTIEEMGSYEFQILVAENGEKALKVLESNPVNLVITDLVMPVMDGLELIRKIRINNKELPVLFLSSAADEGNKRRAFELGATDFIAKPFFSFELKARISGYLERQKAFQALKKVNEKMENELIQAGETQKAIFPEIPTLPNVSMAAKYHSLTSVSGDFYDVFDLRHGNIGILVVDVVGHGISAALISSMIAILFKTHTLNFTSPALTLQIINDLLHPRLQSGKFATVFYGIYNVKHRTITFTSAGHPPAYVMRANDPDLVKLSTDNLILGAFPGSIASYSEQTFQLQTKDRLLLYTDGMLEVNDSTGEPFGKQRLEEFLKKNKGKAIQQILDDLCDEVLSFSDNKFHDDVTVFGMELH